MTGEEARLQDFLWTDMELSSRIGSPESLKAFLLYALFNCVPTEDELERMRANWKSYDARDKAISALRAVFDDQ